jgi:limonene-1,2-epoxide hydrolase
MTHQSIQQSLSRRDLMAGGAVAAAAAAATTVPAVAAAPASKNVEIVLAFCKAGQDRDVERQMTYIAPDSVYHNMPDEPITGAAGIRALLSGYAATEKAEIIVHRIAEASDGVVLTERLDRFMVKGRWIDCPVMGAAEIEGGKIKRWRDYYDNARLNAQMKAG